MEKPIIRWFIKDIRGFNEFEDYNAGSYTTDEAMIIEIQVWNNRYGLKDVKDIDNARLSISFERAEDNILLNFLDANVEENGFEKPDIMIDRCSIQIGKLLGIKNDGISNIKNSDNYKNLVLRFSNMPSNLKSGIKNMLLNIETD